MTYAEKLLATKEDYRLFDWVWKSEPDDEDDDVGFMAQYNVENCMRVQVIFDALIDGLINLGENAPEPEKVKLFETNILALNALNDEFESCFIETTEREDLCELIDIVTEAAGLDPSDYADGDGLSDVWRDW